MIAELSEAPPRRFQMRDCVGPSIGHARHAEMYWQLAQAAMGRWIWFFNDDAGVVNKPGWISAAANPDTPAWDDRLSEIPSGKFFLSPEANIWGKKRVTWNDLPQNRHHACHFPILPNRFWEQCGLTRFQEPLDTFLLNRLTGKGFGGHGCGLGWELNIVPGLTTFHAQERDALFEQQRRTTFFGTEKDGKLLGYRVLTPGDSGGNGSQ